MVGAQEVGGVRMAPGFMDIPEGAGGLVTSGRPVFKFSSVTYGAFVDELEKIGEETPGLRDHVRRSALQSHAIPGAIGMAGLGTMALSVIPKSPYLQVPGLLAGAGMAAFGGFGTVMAAHYNKARRLAMKGVEEGLDDRELAKLKQLNPSLSMVDEMVSQAHHRGFDVSPRAQELVERAGYET